MDPNPVKCLKYFPLCYLKCLLIDVQRLHLRVFIIMCEQYFSLALHFKPILAEGTDVIHSALYNAFKQNCERGQI